MAPTMILEKRWVNRLAVIGGKVSNEITITIPIILRQEMMVSAMNIINKYQLNKEVIVIGLIDHLEIWDREKYLAYEKQVNDSLESLAENLETNNG
jgi:hypothetical protein